MSNAKIHFAGVVTIAALASVQDIDGATRQCTALRLPLERCTVRLTRPSGGELPIPQVAYAAAVSSASASAGNSIFTNIGQPLVTLKD